MKTLVFLMLLLALPGLAQDKTESRELVGQVGNRDALLILHATQRSDGGWQVAGEYVIVNTLQRRFLEGERGPELGVTTLKEGTSAILFGRPATGELRGTWRNGIFRGTRFGPGGQERERFEFSEQFPAMDAYSAAIRCEAGGGRYQSTLAFNAEGGKLKPGSFEWTARVAPAGHACAVNGVEQQAFKGGIRLASTGQCAVTMREVGDFVMVTAENCNAQCGSQAYLEPLLVDRRGNCRLLHPEAR